MRGLVQGMLKAHKAETQKRMNESLEHRVKALQIQLGRALSQEEQVTSQA